MHILHILDELITLANKAKVLLKVSSPTEPVVTLQKDSDNNISFTLKSTCFPFFPEKGFYTFNLDKADLVLDKCRVFVDNLEKNSDMSVESKCLLFEKEDTDIDISNNKKIPNISIFRDGKLIRYKFLLCDYHKNNSSVKLTDRTTRTKEKCIKKCSCKLVKEDIL